MRTRPLHILTRSIEVNCISKDKLVCYAHQSVADSRMKVSKYYCVTHAKGITNVRRAKNMGIQVSDR